MYDSTSPSSTGCMEMPKSTNAVAPRSSSERGRTADKIPTGIEIDSQSSAEPATSDPVTGASAEIRDRTGCRLKYELPNDPWRTRFQRKIQYRCQTGTLKW